MTDSPVLATFPQEGHDHGRCVEDALAAAGLRCTRDAASLTPLRRRVLELVWQSHGPVRAYDLLDRLRAERRSAAPPTVYRALDFLLAHGLIHRIESLNAYVGCSDPDRKHGGQFLICRSCGTVAELDDDGIARAVAERARALGFGVERQTIEVMGLCPGCAAGAAADVSAT